jgi:16S rRNA (guanine527-N7)-methyltransferase
MEKRKKGVHRKPEQIYSFKDADDRLYDVFRNHGFGDFPHELRHRFVEFYQLLMKHQQRDNVTRLLSLRDVGIKHFIDSLMVPRLVTLAFPLLDVGTGPGFPGIPLKFMYPKEPILLAEGVKKRVDFLKTVRDKMKLEELQIIGRNIDSTFEYPVKGVITRALEPVIKTLNSVSNSVEIGGSVYLMKGPNVDAEIKKAEELKSIYVLKEDHAYKLPSTPHERRLLVYRKISSPKAKPTFGSVEHAT